MSPKKQPPKKAGKRTALLEAVPSRKTTKTSAPAPNVNANGNKLDFAPRSTEFVSPIKGGGAAAATVTGHDPTEGRYVYGIIQASQPKAFGKTGIGSAGESVYTVHHG